MKAGNVDDLRTQIALADGIRAKAHLDLVCLAADVPQLVMRGQWQQPAKAGNSPVVRSVVLEKMR